MLQGLLFALKLTTKQSFPNIDVGYPFHQTPTRKGPQAPSPSHPNAGHLAVEILCFPLSFTLYNNTEEEKSPQKAKLDVKVCLPLANWLEVGRKQGEERVVHKKGGTTTATMSCQQAPGELARTCRALYRPGWAGVTREKLNHKHAAQRTDPSVPPETLFMIEMVVPKGLNLMLVSSSL